ncbi:uncharacterized protein RBU33_007576 [Hipposideros larvatus]
MLSQNVPHQKPEEETSLFTGSTFQSLRTHHYPGTPQEPHLLSWLPDGKLWGLTDKKRSHQFSLRKSGLLEPWGSCHQNVWGTKNGFCYKWKYAAQTFSQERNHR